MGERARESGVDAARPLIKATRNRPFGPQARANASAGFPESANEHRNAMPTMTKIRSPHTLLCPSDRSNCMLGAIALRLQFGQQIPAHRAVFNLDLYMVGFPLCKREFQQTPALKILKNCQMRNPAIHVL